MAKQTTVGVIGSLRANKHLMAITPDKVLFFNQKVLLYFLFLKNVCCEYCWDIPVTWSYKCLVYQYSVSAYKQMQHRSEFSFLGLFNPL